MKTTQLLTEFSHLVDSIYEAALEPSLWPSAVERIAHIHQSEKALLFTPLLAPALGGFAFPHGLSETSMLEWGNRYIALDIWTQTGIRMDLAPGQAVLDTDLVSDDVLLSSPFYTEFLSRHHIRRLCTGLVFAYTDQTLPPTCCSIYAPEKRGPFDDVSRHLHHLTLNHLSRALGTMIRLRDAELRLASTLGALNRLTGNILLLDQGGHVVFANDAAQALLKTADGLSLSKTSIRGRPYDRLKAWQRADDASLNADIRRSTLTDPADVDHFTNSVRVTRPSGKQPFVVQVTSLSERSSLASTDGQPSAVAFINDPEARIQLSDETGRSVYGFTPAETRLANAILSGLTIEGIAKRAGTSQATLRSQLKNLFLKTGTSRQPELMKLLMSVASRR